MTIHRWTILFGVLLVAVGLGGYFLSDGDNPLSLAPAVLGVAMFVCGLVEARGAMRMMDMHVAALIGLVGFAGPLAALTQDAVQTATVLSNGLTSALSFVFVMLCINSFLEARRARKAGKNVDEKLDADVKEEQDSLN